MSSTIISDTVIKICIFDIRITNINCLFYKSIIIYNIYKTNKVGPRDNSSEIIGNRKYSLIIFYLFNVIATNKINILYVKIGIISLK